MAWEHIWDKQGWPNKKHYEGYSKTSEWVHVQHMNFRMSLNQTRGYWDIKVKMGEVEVNIAKYKRSEPLCDVNILIFRKWTFAT